MLNFLVLIDVIQRLSAIFATISICGFKHIDWMHYFDLLCNCSVATSRQGEAPVWTTPRNLNKLHKIDMQGHIGKNWGEKNARWIAFWNKQDQMIIVRQPIHGPPSQTHEYMEWYFTNLIPFLTMQGPQVTIDMEVSNTSAITHQNGTITCTKEENTSSSQHLQS